MRAISNIVTSGGGINSTLTVTCSDDFIGETLTCTNGTKSITKTVPLSMNVVFNLSSAGTWVLSNSLTPETSSYVVENIEYDATLSNVPDGKTVLPTDDIQTWLNCADIWDKEYTTLAEVLADKDTLVKLMASDNAVDYMVRSATWAESEAFVPNMTGYTTPEGEVFCSSEYSGIPAWQLFDGDKSTRWVSNATADYVGYKFTSKKIVGSLYYYQVASNATELGRLPKNFTLQGSNDGSTWIDIQYYVGLQQQDNKFSTSNTTEYQYYRINITSNYGQSVIQINELQFYSVSIPTSSIAMQAINASDYASDTLLANSTWREAICNSEYFETILNKKSPIMTSNTTPSGICSANFVGGLVEGQAYNGFDGNTSTYTFYSNATLSNVLDGYIEYDFDSSFKISRIDIRNSKGTSSAGTITFYTEAYDDASGEWVAFGDSYEVSSITADNVILDSKESSKVRFKVSSTFAVSGKYMWGEIVTCSIYGRQPGGVQTWLHKAGITNKNYTTLAEVLNDSATLSTLMANEDAVDYLVTCKGWATAQALVPTMTSNTTPSGVCVASSEDNPAYYAFNGNTSNGWSSTTVGTSNLGRIGYKFTEPVDINKVSLLHFNSASFTCKVQYSDDGVNWTDVEDSTFTAVQNTQANISFDTGSHLYWAVYYLSASTSTRASVNELQFYTASITDSEAAMVDIGLNNYTANVLLADEEWCNAICNSEYFESVLNVKVPAMTGYTTPEGVVSAKSESGSYLAWKAFDRNDSTYWQTADNALPQWIQYKFVSSVKAYLVSAWWGIRYPTQLRIQGSNDNSTWTDLTETLSGTGASTTDKYVISSPSNYLYYRLNIIQVNASPYNVYSSAIQFYGREDV